MLSMTHYEGDGSPTFVFDMMERKRPKVDLAMLSQIGGVASGRCRCGGHTVAVEFDLMDRLRARRRFLNWLGKLEMDELRKRGAFARGTSFDVLRVGTLRDTGHCGTQLEGTLASQRAYPALGSEGFLRMTERTTQLEAALSAQSALIEEAQAEIIRPDADDADDVSTYSSGSARPTAVMVMTRSRDRPLRA
jgi:hypothetical protein